MQQESDNNTKVQIVKKKRQGKYLFQPGTSGNYNGRPKETEQTKLIRKARKEFIAEYKQGLAEALPNLQPILIAKALEGDMQAIKELNDRVMGKPEQSIDATSGGEKLSFNVISFKDATDDSN